MRFYEDEKRDRAIARLGSWQFFIELREIESRRRQPRIVRIATRPVLIGVICKREQVLCLLGKQLVSFVALAQLHRLIAHSQRAHFEFSKVLVTRRTGKCGLSDQQHEADVNAHDAPTIRLGDICCYEFTASQQP